MAQITAEAVAAINDRRDKRFAPNDVLVCSTGRIGVQMPMKNVERGIRICAPLIARSGRKAREAAEAIMENLQEAASGADVLYTDIWVSMGKEAEEARRQADLGPYWINQALVKQAKPEALVMHCLPAHRGQEIEDAVMEGHVGR